MVGQGPKYHVVWSEAQRRRGQAVGRHTCFEKSSGRGFCSHSYIMPCSFVAAVRPLPALEHGTAQPGRPDLARWGWPAPLAACTRPQQVAALLARRLLRWLFNPPAVPSS